MKNRTILILAGCLALAACNDDKELTLGMSENQLINTIDLKVTPQLPVAVGMDTTIVYSVTPADAANTEVIWSSSDEKVATVSQNGTITGLSEGEAVITVMPILGFGVTNITLQSIEVKVIPEIIKATSIEFTNKDDQGNAITELYQTDNLELNYNILPADHTYSYITFGSSDETLATVDEKGVVTGVEPGEVTIYAYTHDRSNTVGKYNLKILPYIPVEDITIKPYTENLYMYQTVTLDYTMTPASATASTVKWTSSDENIATVKQGKVTAVGFGTVTITAECIANGNSASTTITVEPGWWIWDGRNDFKNWKIGQAYSSLAIVDGKMVVTCGAQNAEKKRADLQLPASDKAPIYMHIGQYPVLALRTTLPSGGVEKGKGGAYTLDVVALDGTNGGSKRCDTGIILPDGTHLIYYDFAALNKFPVELVGFKTFNIKVADIFNENLPTSKYTVYWIRTFKSVAEAEAYAKAEIAAE